MTCPQRSDEPRSARSASERQPLRRRSPRPGRRQRQRSGHPDHSRRGRAPKRPDLAATDEEVRQEIERVADLAKYSCIYYELLLQKLERRDFGIRLGSGLVSSAGIVAALKFLGASKGEVVAVAIACSSGALSVYSLAAGLPTEIKNAASVQQRWIGLMHRAERLLVGTPTERAMRALQDEHEEVEKLEAEKLRGTDKKLLNEAYKKFCAETGRQPPDKT